MISLPWCLKPMPAPLTEWDHHMKAKREGRVSSNLRGQVNAYERALVMQALKTAKGNQSHAAKILGTSQRIVNYKIQKYGIDTTQFR